MKILRVPGNTYLDAIIIWKPDLDKYRGLGNAADFEQASLHRKAMFVSSGPSV